MKSHIEFFFFFLMVFPYGVNYPSFVASKITKILLEQWIWAYFFNPNSNYLEFSQTLIWVSSCLHSLLLIKILQLTQLLYMSSLWFFKSHYFQFFKIFVLNLQPVVASTFVEFVIIDLHLKFQLNWSLYTPVMAKTKFWFQTYFFNKLIFDYVLWCFPIFWLSVETSLSYHFVTQLVTSIALEDMGYKIPLPSKIRQFKKKLPDCVGPLQMKMLTTIGPI